jgi:hypothetical protein
LTTNAVSLAGELLAQGVRPVTVDQFLTLATPRWELALRFSASFIASAPTGDADTVNQPKVMSRWRRITAREQLVADQCARQLFNKAQSTGPPSGDSANP